MPLIMYENCDGAFNKVLVFISIKPIKIYNVISVLIIMMQSV